jgi:hypothetical protein
VTVVSPFRLFGRTPEPEPDVEQPPDTGHIAWAPGPWGGSATAHARPVPTGRPELGRYADADDPPTDPFGFPPLRDDTSGRLAEPPPDHAEAAALAGAFAADYLSWDEDDPARRGRALAEHLGAAVDDPAHLGWDGRGRQRAEFALPGLVRPDGDGRVLVDVRVRVTPYRSVADRRADRLLDAAEPEQDVPGVPAAAPAPTGRGWRGLASYWIRLSVPVVGEGDRLVVDPGEEDGPPPGVDVRALRDGPEPPAEDDPLPELAAPAPGGAW